MNALERKQIYDAYRSMMTMDAWKDLTKYIYDECELSVKRSDCKSAAELTVGEICEERGIRKGLIKILQHAEFKREGV